MGWHERKEFGEASRAARLTTQKQIRRWVEGIFPTSIGSPRDWENLYEGVQTKPFVPDHKVSDLTDEGRAQAKEVARSLPYPDPEYPLSQESRVLPRPALQGETIPPGQIDSYVKELEERNYEGWDAIASQSRAWLLATGRVPFEALSATLQLWELLAGRWTIGEPPKFKKGSELGNFVSKTIDKISQE